MKLKYALMTTTAALVLTVSGLAHAQSNSAAPGSTMAPKATSPAPRTADQLSALPGSTLHEIKDNKAMVMGMNVNVKDLNDMAVYGSDGKKIGEINRVLGDGSNTAKAVAVDAGGFLGMGTHEVVFPLDKLSKGSEKNHLSTSLTKDEIKNLEAYKTK